MADKKPEPKPPQAVEDIPDPDEDDLDDLDDVLDEFAATNIEDPAPSTAPAPSGPGRPSAAAPPTAPSAVDEDDFARQLQAGMADLLGELESSPEMQKQFEELVKGLGEAAVAGAAGSETGQIPEVTASAAQAPTAGKEKAGSAAKAAEDSFQEQIRKTMDRMQHSSSTADTAAASGADDPLAQLLKEMEAGNFPGADGGGDEDFSKMLLGMMEQLTNKEILYEPMKELHDKFPEWLEKNKDKTDKGDLERYEEQQRLVNEIVGKFEEKGYSDDNAAHREYIVERMQKMQAAGSPPPDLVGGMNAAQEALGELDSGCPTQ
ncbi:hypothetical protein W97_02037 [Coniosporium apollinis CBS 100218]|uniref:Uncharacterized protein n=1 Tax=Coniosporium apollinis (strain CBS 100218) TaxID=1168221 RepID=R7YLL3_CONA1|nr:uncharacterized protein W97_02037 [Coniosporium apollinis CBS 100218]EON62812.1 hypothetical protein W97_02037 [Coniosporium apollinis CBS 100218]